MKIFKLDERFSVICDWKRTRNGFKHEATLCSNGSAVVTVKCCYLNRTWEAYEYESVLRKLIGQQFEGAEQAKYLEAVKYENIN